MNKEGEGHQVSNIVRVRGRGRGPGRKINPNQGWVMYIQYLIKQIGVIIFTGRTLEV